MNNLSNPGLDNELDKLEAISDIIGTALVNRNGLLISSRLPRDIDDRKLGAMAATMFKSIETAASALGSKIINNLTVEFSEFQMIVIGVDEHIVLVTLINLNTNLGLVFIEIEDFIRNIKEILKR